MSPLVLTTSTLSLLLLLLVLPPHHLLTTVTPLAAAAAASTASGYKITAGQLGPIRNSSSLPAPRPVAPSLLPSTQSTPPLSRDASRTPISPTPSPPETNSSSQKLAPSSRREPNSSPQRTVTVPPTSKTAAPKATKTDHSRVEYSAPEKSGEGNLEENRTRKNQEGKATKEKGPSPAKVAVVDTGDWYDNDKDDESEDSSPEFSWQTFVIIVITILIVLSNCAIIMVVAWTEAFSNFNKIFIYSLALADLLIGLFITPYSIFLSVYRSWVFESDVFCSVEAYMFTTLISAKMYSLTWLNVDQYVAVRKPERYNSMMTPARSLCWILFSWVVVISFCCPPLFSLEASIFDSSSYICMIDTKQQIAYVLTAGVLVCTPSIVTTVITGAYLFTKSFKKQIQFYEKVFVDLCTRPWNYHITFTMSVVFLGVWFPFTCVYIIKYFLNIEMERNLLFVLCWLGISTGFSQFIVLFAMSPDFRRALKELVRFPEICRRSSGPPAGMSPRDGIEARDTPPPAYLTFFEKYTAQDAGSSNMSPSPRSLTRGAGDRRTQSRRSGTHESGSTSTSSIPYVDAMGSLTGMQYRGVYSTGTPPSHV